MKICLFLLFSLSLVGAERIIITGSSTVAPVLSDIARSFEKSHRGYRVDVQTGGSSRGIKDTRAKVADIGMVSRALKKEEGDLIANTIALDGLAVIVNSKNSVSELSEQQIRDIYLGKISNWKQVKAGASTVVVVNKAEGRSTLELFLKFLKIKNSDIKASVVIGDNEQGIKTVASNPGAIAYVSIGAAEYNMSLGVPIKLLPMRGVEASVANVENGSYPFARQLNLVSLSDKKDNTAPFFSYLKSAEAHIIIKEHYFVPYKLK